MAIISLLEKIIPAPSYNTLSIELKTESELALIDQFIAASQNLPEQVYEGCMHARILEGSHGDECGVLLIRFEKELGLHRLPIHRHTFSSRKVLIVSGEGTFHFQHPETGVHEKVIVNRGSLVCFPKGLFHTFTTESLEMSVIAVHDPFQELDDEQILEYNERTLPSSSAGFLKAPFKLKLA